MICKFNIKLPLPRSRLTLHVCIILFPQREWCVLFLDSRCWNYQFYSKRPISFHQHICMGKLWRGRNVRSLILDACCPCGSSGVTVLSIENRHIWSIYLVAQMVSQSHLIPCTLVTQALVLSHLHALEDLQHSEHLSRSYSLYDPAVKVLLQAFVSRTSFSI